MEYAESPALSNLRKLHSIYVNKTGYDVKFEIHYHTFKHFVDCGFTDKDLEMVLDWMNMENRRNTYKRSMRLGKVIGDEIAFDEMRAEAAAVLRNRRPKRTPAQQALQEWNPVVEEPLFPGRVVSIKEAMLKAIEQTEMEQRNEARQNHQ